MPRHNPAAAKRIVLAGILTFLLLGILTVATVRGALASAHASGRAVAASHERIAKLDGLLTLVLETEVGQRGYVITGDRAFLAPYEDALLKLRSARNILGLVDRKHAATLSLLIDEKLAFIAGTVKLRRDAGLDAAALEIRQGRGKQLMDGIRAELEWLVRDEHQELARREAMRAAEERVERLTIYGALVGALSIAAIVGLLLRRELHFRGLAEQEARQRTVFLRATLENLDHGVALLDQQGRIVECNDKLASFLPDGLTGVERDADLAGAARARLPLLKVLSPDDDRCIEIRGSSAPDTNYVVTFTDISERRRIEKMKTAFVSNVSHELRTPLTSIRAALGLLAGPLKNGLSDQVRKLVTIADRNAVRLLDLVNDLLDIDKIESGKMAFDFAPADLNGIAEEAAEANRAYAEQRGVGIALGLPASAVDVNVDSARIQQVMANLLSNASKFSPQGSTVVIAVEKASHEARICVHDSGPGVPESFRGAIFEKFSQARSSDSTKLGGSGLGLNIAKSIVESHGGKLAFDSRPGDTNFWFTLPLHHN